MTNNKQKNNELCKNSHKNKNKTVKSVSDFDEIITDGRNQISDDFTKKCEEKNTKLVILAC